MSKHSLRIIEISATRVTSNKHLRDKLDLQDAVLVYAYQTLLSRMDLLIIQ